MAFEFSTAARIIFGPGTLPQTGPLVAAMGRRVLVVTGRASERAAPLLSNLASQGLAVYPFAVAEEPTVDVIVRGTEQARSDQCDVVIGFGGGSVLDAGKAMAILMTNKGEPLDYLEVIGRGKPISRPSAPYVAIPTTAGTGTEVTRNAVLGSPKHKVKVSLRSPLMLPQLALIDPELTHSLPSALTASTGLDALTQVMEPYVSHKANPLADALCREGMRRVAHSLRRAFENGNDPAAREDMALASLYGGLALANAKLGAVHGFAGPFGGMYPAPHGATCAALLPHVMAVNVQALQSRLPDTRALKRYEEVAQLVTGNPKASAADGAAWVQDLCHDLQVLPLSRYGLTEDDFPDLMEKASRASSMKGNPVELSKEEMTEILSRAL